MTIFSRRFLCFLAFMMAANLLSFSALVKTAQASLRLQKSRLLIEAPSREVSESVVNKGAGSLLVQSWLTPSHDLKRFLKKTKPRKQGKIYFLATPPLFRLDPGRQGVVRILGSPTNLPEDRESYFWLSIQEIPPMVREPKQDNRRRRQALRGSIQFSLTQRLRVFYRPEDLSSSFEQAAKALKFYIGKACGRRFLVLNNPTPYYMSLGRMRLQAKGRHISFAMIMVAPYSVHAAAFEGKNEGIENKKRSSQGLFWRNEAVRYLSLSYRTLSRRGGFLKPSSLSHLTSIMSFPHTCS